MPRLVNRSFAPSCLHFSGISQNVNIASNDSVDVTTSDFSLSCWFRCKAGQAMTDNRLIIKKAADGFANAGYLIRFTSPTQLQPSIIDEGANTLNATETLSKSINDGMWHHLVMSFARNSSTGLNFYIDGVKVGTSRSTTIITGTLTNTGNFRVNHHGASNLIGFIDEVMLFKRALSLQDVINIYHYNKLDPTNLQLYWKFDENTGTSANDASGNGNTGTLANSPTWSTDVAFSARSATGTARTTATRSAVGTARTVVT